MLIKSEFSSSINPRQDPSSSQFLFSSSFVLYQLGDDYSICSLLSLQLYLYLMKMQTSGRYQCHEGDASSSGTSTWMTLDHFKQTIYTKNQLELNWILISLMIILHWLYMILIILKTVLITRMYSCIILQKLYDKSALISISWMSIGTSLW